MSKEFIEGFIEIYRSHECLWKISSPDYTNKNLKKIAYNELVAYCRQIYKSADHDFVKQKIQNLRTAFRKELRKVRDLEKSASGTAEEVYSPKLWYFHLLLFTVDDDVLPQQYCNIELEEKNIADCISEDTNSNSNSAKKLKIGESGCGGASHTLSVSLSGTSQKSKPVQNFQCSPSTSKQSAKFQPNQNQNSTHKEEIFPRKFTEAINEINNMNTKRKDVDEFDAIAISWAAKLRKLKEEQLVLAEGLISEVLKKAYFEELTRATRIKDETVFKIEDEMAIGC